MTRTRLTVLALEDDPGDALLLRRHLDNIGNWDVELLVCETTTEALSTLASGLIDLVFIDYFLGAESGLAALRTIQSAGHRIPIAFLTGRGDPSIAGAVLDAGAADYIAKGLMSPNSLRRLIQNAVEKARLDYLVRRHRHDIQRMQDGLARRNHEISRLSYLLTHQLRGSLTSIHDFVSIVLDGVAGPVTNAQREHLSLALQGCNDISKCLDDLLTPELVDAVRSMEASQPDNADANDQLRAS